MTDDDLSRLGRSKVPAPSKGARERALSAALEAFDEKISPSPQGTRRGARLTDKAIMLWRSLMSRKLIASPALAALIALPVAG